MRNIIKVLGISFSVLWAMLLPPEASAAKSIPITIGTGALTGIYFPTGGAICKMINANKAKHGIACSIESTAGSEYNVKMIEAGKLDLAIVQSDVGYQAIKGRKPFQNKAANLRSLFSIHPEILTLVAHKSTGIRNLMDLKGKRINLGSLGSGPRQTVMELLKACGIKKSDFSLAGSMEIEQVPEAMRDNKLDAYFHVIGHPAPPIFETALYTDIDIVPITGQCVDKLASEKPYYDKMKIPAGIYRGVDHPVSTICTKATLLAGANVPANIVYQFVKAVFDNLKDFKQLHPAYENLTTKGMTTALSIPLHPGAIKYFEEKGLIK